MKRFHRRPRAHPLPQISITRTGLTFLLSCFLALGVVNSFAQTFTATLTGVVSDPQGAVVPGVTVQIKNQATSDIRESTTGPDGGYVFSNLLPGTYEISVAAQGFKTFLQRNITLLASRSAELNIKLEIGQLAQSVEVTGTAVLVDTKTANDMSTLTSTMVAELPNNTLSPLNFVFALAGTVPAPGGMYSPDGTIDQNFNSFSLQGSRALSTQILMDGAPGTAGDWGAVQASPLVGSVQEMQVISNTYDAQYGKAGGGIVTLVSKSGTSKLHGTAYDFVRSENLDATSWWSNKNVPNWCPDATAECNRQKKGEFKRQQFGGNLGGPIWESKHLYFFGAYEGLRQPYSGSSTMRVPTALERQGDFSETYNYDGSLAVIYNPFSTVEDPLNPGVYLRTAFDPTCEGVMYPDTCAGNRIPSTLLDPVGQRVLDLYPEATSRGLGPEGRENWGGSSPGRITNDKIEARVDWARSEKHRMFGRWTQRLRQNNSGLCYFCNGADGALDGTVPAKNMGFHFTLDNTFTPTPNWVVSVLLGLSYAKEQQIAAALGKLTAADIGLDPGLFHAAIIPAFSIDGLTGIGTQFGQKVRQFPRYDNSLQVNVTKEHGAHTFKFGWMGEQILVNNVDRFSGNFGFGRGMTSGPIASTDDPSLMTGSGIASLLMGSASSGNTQFNIDVAGSTRYYGAYFLDTWRVNRKLTLMLGARYEIQPGMTERFNRLSYFNQDIANPLGDEIGMPLRGGIQFASASDRRGWITDKSDFAPRIGISWQPREKMVVRAGFGIFYVPTTAMITFDQPGQHMGFSTDTQMVPSVGGGGLIPLNLLSDPYPDGLSQPTGSSGGLMTGIGGSPGQIWPWEPHPTGYKQNFSVDFQYELGPGTVLEVGYAGFRARKLMWGNPGLNANQLNPEYLSLGSALDEQVDNPFYGHVPEGTFLSGPTIARHRLLRAFPQFDSLNWTRSWVGARANYDALNVKFTRQFRGGLTLLSTYQWSKTKDDASEDYLGWATDNQWRDYFNRKQEYSISSHDMPQSFVTAMVYELPFGHGKKWGNNWPGAANHVLGGWQTSSIIRFTSGLPILAVPSGGMGDYGFSWGYMNLVGDPCLGNRTPERWFNTEAFAYPDWYTLGDAPRMLDCMRDQGTKNVDFSLAKSFKAEAFKIQFRADFLNFFNTPQFGGGGQWWTGIQNQPWAGDFGQVVGVRNLPRNIQLGLKVEF
ncbi:MAG: TonB-dependent receptor domain-containing protein [Terriglobia bacterium]